MHDVQAPAVPTTDTGTLSAMVRIETPTGVIELPRPYATVSADHPLQVIDRTAENIPHVPAGFSIKEFATGLSHARSMALAPNGDVVISDHTHGSVHLFRDADHDGRAEMHTEFAHDLAQPFGLAFHPSGYLYVANTNAVVRFRYHAGQTVSAGPPERIVPLPGNGYHQHWTRNIAFSADSRRLMISVGSETNVEAESDPRRGAILEYDPEGRTGGVFASGLRNPIGLAFAPNGVLFTVVNERDELGDDLVPDFLTSVQHNGFYGWPYAWFGPHEDPRRAGERPDLVARAIVPDLSLGAHVAPISVVFYNGTMFPTEYQGDAFVSLHGSWNRAHPVGYSVVRVRFRNGSATSTIEPFVTGWQVDDAHVWGRPAGLLVAQDGALLIADDESGVIWRVARSSE